MPLPRFHITPPPADLYERTKELAYKTILNHVYEVLDLVGHSRDERPTVYVDQRLPYRLPQSQIRPDDTLPFRELAMTILINMGWPATKARDTANEIEHRRAEELQPGSWPAYQREMQDWARQLSRRGFERMPPDQDRRGLVLELVENDAWPEEMRPTKLKDQTTRPHDPTRTRGLRKSFRAAAQIQLNQVRASLRNAVVEYNMLGLAGAASANQFLTPAARLNQFADWFEVAAFASLDSKWWVTPWLNKAIASGLIRASREAGSNSQPTIYHDSFAALHQLAKQEVDGIVAAMVQKVARMAHNAVASHKRPVAAYRRMTKHIDSDTKNRLKAFANSMTVKAHNAAKIETYRQSGVEQVGINPERFRQTIVVDADVGVATAEDDLVCEECQDIADGSPYSLDEADDLIPAHANCRCSVFPWDDDQGYTGDSWDSYSNYDGDQR